MDQKFNPVPIETSTSVTTATIKTSINLPEPNLPALRNIISTSSSNENQNSDKSDLPAPPPKVTVSLPKDAASRLRTLAQNRDIALVKLGILSIQFENDQIIPLALNTANVVETMVKTKTIAKDQDQAEKQRHPNDKTAFQEEPQVKDIKFSMVRDQLPSVDESIQDLNASITTYTSFNSPSEEELMIPGDDLNLDVPNLNVTNSTMMDSSLIVATTLASAMPKQINSCNNSKLTVPYDDDDDEDVKEEDEATTNELFSRGQPQLTQLEFADPIELEMYESDNLLFPDYTLNLS